MVVADELRQLQLQVDKIKERLDFMAPMLSLMNFTQDYFQSMEAEASVQLMRLKNVHMGATSSTSEGQGHEPHSVELATWVHRVTDLVMHLQGPGPGGAEGRREPQTLQPSAQPALDEARPTPRDGDQLRALRQQGRGGGFGGGARMPRAPQQGGLVDPGAPQAWPPAGSTASAGSSASSWSSSAGQRARPDARAAGAMGKGLGGVTGARYDVQPQGGGGAATLESTLEFGGLALGRGTWANAYRQAVGARRDALRLLCTSSIVTERELADDLTVISEEHIEECIQIAGEMLQRWPPEHGPPPTREAKVFFEERLAALYMKRAPPPFGL